MEGFNGDRPNVILHAQECNILSPSQHGFLANRSTSSQLLECMHDWCTAVQSEKDVS